MLPPDLLPVFREIVAREAPDLPIEIDSAGTAAYNVGSPPDSRTRQAALRRGYDMSALRARVVELGGLQPPAPVHHVHESAGKGDARYIEHQREP